VDHLLSVTTAIDGGNHIFKSRHERTPSRGRDGSLGQNSPKLILDLPTRIPGISGDILQHFV
jgi:hypothetical protein